MKKINLLVAVALGLVGISGSVFASTCDDLPKAATLKKKLMSTVVLHDGSVNGGVGAPVWLTLIDTSGKVCAIVHSLPEGVDVTTELAINHRVLSVHKAGIANGFSRESLSVSSGNIYAGSQSGEIASGMDGFVNYKINPYGGDPATWGTEKDPLVGKRLGGNSAQPGGLALFNSDQVKVGAIGVSGDFRCTDHVVAWKVREKLRNGAYTVDNVPFGLSAAKNDALMQDMDENGKSASGFGYFTCMNNPTDENDGGAIEGN